MSGKTVAQKLLVRPRATVWVSDGEQASLVGALPPGASLVREPAGAHVAIVVAPDAATVRSSLAAHGAAFASAAAFWVLYPKGGRADINRDTLWPIVAEFSMRPISQVAVDDTWSALRFRTLRPGEAPFTGGR